MSARATLSTSAVRFSVPTEGDYKNILVSTPAEGVRLVTLNRPKALNALNSELFHEVNAAADAADNDPSIGCLLYTSPSPRD